MARSCSFWHPSTATPASQSVPRGSDGCRTRLSQSLLAHRTLVRVTGWHADDRTRVLPRLNGQPGPRAVLARAPRDLPCSPREPCSPGERGPLLVTALLAVPMLLIHAISERPPKSPPLRHGLPRPAALPRPRPPAITCPPPRPSPGGAGYLARHAARGGPPRGPASKPPDLRAAPPAPPAGPRRNCSASGPAQPHSRRA